MKSVIAFCLVATLVFYVRGNPHHKDGDGNGHSGMQNDHSGSGRVKVFANFEEAKQKFWKKLNDKIEKRIKGEQPQGPHAITKDHPCFKERPSTSNGNFQLSPQCNITKPATEVKIENKGEYKEHCFQLLYRAGEVNYVDSVMVQIPKELSSGQSERNESEMNASSQKMETTSTQQRTSASQSSSSE